MTRTQMAAVALMTVFSCNATAVAVRGMPSCGQWIKDRTGQPTAVTVGNESWLMGFLSGMAIEANQDFLRNVDPDSLYAFVDKHCRENPLDELGLAAFSLRRALLNRKTM